MTFFPGISTIKKISQAWTAKLVLCHLILPGFATTQILGTRNNIALTRNKKAQNHSPEQVIYRQRKFNIMKILKNLFQKVLHSTH